MLSRLSRKLEKSGGRKVLPEHYYFTIRDKGDEPILYFAITADVDVLITGDKDFADIDIVVALCGDEST